MAAKILLLIQYDWFWFSRDGKENIKLAKMVLKRKYVAQEGNYRSPEEQLTESMNII